jgi:succinate dehydrogenase / fumarate reductase flavoprotein subunit
MASIAAAEAGASPLLVTDGPVGRSNSVMAQGGIQLPGDSQSSREGLVVDMLDSARVPVDAQRVRRFAAELGPIVELVAAWGLPLDRDPQGEPMRHTAGGMSEARVVSVSDRLGPSLVRVLRGRLDALGVEVLTGVAVEGVQPEAGGIGLLLAGGSSLAARAVVIATGGIAFDRATQLGERTTNPPNRNRRLVDVLRGLGVATVHESYYQYQPFGVVDIGGFAGVCVPETVAELPVRLLDGRGDPVARLGSDRLVVTEAIFSALRRGDGVAAEHGEGVLLTLGDVEGSDLAERFPSLHRTLARHGLAGGHVVVRPFLHYWLGGFVVDADCATSVPGLFLAGEIVGGLHGRNRLMGNGIADALVHGRRAGLAAAGWAS